MRDTNAVNRIQRLADLLSEHGNDIFLAQTAASLGYLVNFPEDAHERFMALAIHKSGQSVLICPALSSIQARRAGIENIRDWRDGENPVALFEQLCDEWDAEAAVFLVDDHLPAKMLLEMQAALPGALFKPGGTLLGELTGRKDHEEIRLMKEAGRIADEVFLHVKQSLREGMTELELERIIRDAFVQRGGTPSFCIVGFGPGAAESHHINSDTQLRRNDLVLVDFGCDYEGYQSDITRVICFGEPTPKMREVYNIVYQAHQAGAAAAMVGAIPAEVDAATRRVIEQAGYGQYFTHRTGHGIGMQVHEHPNISPDNTTPLAEGNCFSIEPGIYLPGEFGVRLENLYCAGQPTFSFNTAISPTLETV